MSQAEFDFDEAIRQREAGMETSAANQAEGLEQAREIALQLGRFLGTVTSDDVRREWADRKLGPWIGNAAGAIFTKKEDWEWAGFKTSEVPIGHGNRINRWRLKKGR